MPYKTIYQHEMSEKIPNSLNDPYNSTSYFYNTENFVFNFADSTQNQLNNLYQDGIVDKIPNSLNDPYNSTSYFYTRENFLPFNFGGGGSGQSQLNDLLAQQQAEQNQVVQQLKRQQQERQQEEQAAQGVQRILHLQLFQKQQQRQIDDDLKIIRHLNQEINKLDKLIDIARR